MSLFKQSLHAIRSLLFNEGCMVCGEAVSDSMRGVCTMCRYTIPLTNYWLEDVNPVKERFDGIIPVEQASSFFFFSGSSIWRTLIHRFKYGNMWRIAERMGEWYGSELKLSGRYDDIDVIIPVPLHYLKIMQRGYNQSTYLAEGIARGLGAKVDSSAVRRIRNNPSQARMYHSDRWDNVENIFAVRHAERLRGKHLLIVDDVLTTGATITSCAQTILRAVPDCRISIATLAVTRKIVKE